MGWSEFSERRLAVITSWAFLGSFGLCFVISGFRGADLLSGLFGFALFAAAFGVHVIVNQIFDSRFSKGEVALGLVVLDDDRRYFPVYDAAPVARAALLLKYPQVAEALRALEGRIPATEMRKMNRAVDEGKQDPGVVVRAYLDRLGGLSSQER